MPGLALGDSAVVSDTRPHVLVCDDEPAIGSLIETILTMPDINATTKEVIHPGFRVSLANDGDVALEMLINGLFPDLIIMDLMMPRLPGAVAMKRIREHDRLRQIPIMALSAGSNLRSMSLPEADALLPKPFDIDALVAQVRFWTNRRINPQCVEDMLFAEYAPPEIYAMGGISPGF